MFVRIFLVILSVAVLTRAAAAPPKRKSVKPDCQKYKLPACTREYVPVCGTDWKTYGNECELCAYNWEYDQNIKIKKYGEC